MSDIDLTQFEGHTPGEWVVEGALFDEGDGSWPIFRWNHDKCDMVCKVMVDDYLETKDGTQEANARLIASAPELLAEVLRLRAVLELVAEMMAGFDADDMDVFMMTVAGKVEAALDGGRDDS